MVDNSKFHSLTFLDVNAIEEGLNFDDGSEQQGEEAAANAENVEAPLDIVNNEIALYRYY